MKLDRSVQISGYGLNDQQIVVRFPTEVRNLPLLQIAQTCFGAQPTSYAGGTALFLREHP